MANLFLRPSQGTCVVPDPCPPLLGIPAARLPSFPGRDACSTVGSTGLCLFPSGSAPRGRHCDREDWHMGRTCGVCVGGHRAFCPGGDRALFSWEGGCHEAEQQPMLSLAPTNTKP